MDQNGNYDLKSFKAGIVFTCAALLIILHIVYNDPYQPRPNWLVNITWIATASIVAYLILNDRADKRKQTERKEMIEAMTPKEQQAFFAAERTRLKLD